MLFRYRERILCKIENITMITLFERNMKIRKKYNRNYWETNKDKYLEERSKNAEHHDKTKHRLYNHNYYIIREEIPEDTNLKMKDIEIHSNTTKS
jgi:hypothetical protein